jgi:Uma2 family endonuclease
MDTYIKPPRTGMEAFEMMPEGTLCQLINDNLVMSPAPNTPHAIIQGEIFVALFNYVRSKNLGKAFCAPVDVYLNDENIFQPDIFFISTAKSSIIKKRGIFGAPDLVIEILSQDRNIDLVKKKAVYEQCGVTEYWVVDPETKKAEGFTLQENIYASIGASTGSISILLLQLAIEF